MGRKIAAVFSGCIYGSIGIAGILLPDPVGQGVGVKLTVHEHQAAFRFLRQFACVQLCDGDVMLPTGTDALQQNSAANKIASKFFPISHKLLMGDLPRVELFARQKIPGWDAWGNEIASDIQLAERS